MTIHIIDIDHYYNPLPGGIQQYLFNLARTIIEEDHKDESVVLVVSTPSGANLKDVFLLTKKIMKDPDRVDVYLGVHDYHGNKRLLKESINYMNVVKRYLAIMRKHPSNRLIVHTGNYMHALLLTRLARGISSTTIIFYHLTKPVNYLISKFSNSILQDRVIHCASSTTLSRLYSTLLNRKIHVIPPPVFWREWHLEATPMKPRELDGIDMYSYDFILSYIGILDPQRAPIDLFIKLLVRLRIRGYNPLFIVAVRHDSRFEHWRKALKVIAGRESWKLHENLIILDRFLTFNEKLFIIKNSLLGIYFYLEPLRVHVTDPPYTILEYLAAGTSVVATPRLELAQLARNGLIVPIERASVEELAEKVLTVYRKGFSREEAIRYVREYHDPNVIYSKLKNVISYDA